MFVVLGGQWFIIRGVLLGVLGGLWGVVLLNWFCVGFDIKLNQETYVFVVLTTLGVWLIACLLWLIVFFCWVAGSGLLSGWVVGGAEGAVGGGRVLLSWCCIGFDIELNKKTYVFGFRTALGVWLFGWLFDCFVWLYLFNYLCSVDGSGLLLGCVVGGAERAVGGSLAEVILCWFWYKT